MTNLRFIIEDTGASIVVSSSWRHLGIPRLQQLWRDWNLPGEIIGRTPGWWGDKEFFEIRGLEIEKWLADNTQPPYRYVVIDDLDLSEATERQKNIWIKVDPICGISQADAQLAAQLLNTP